MFWKILYWTVLYGVNQRLKNWSIIIDQIGFGDYDFSDILISNIPDSYDGNEFDLQAYELTTHGQGLSNWLIKNKKLTIRWWIQAENQQELEQKINRIKANLLNGEKTLIIKRKIWLLKTKAVVSGLSIPRNSWTINTVGIEITFKISDPFMYSVHTNELWFLWINALFNTTIEYLSGSHSAKPSVYIAFKSAENVNKVELTIWWKVLQISQNLHEWDILTINGEKLDVALNWRYGIDRVGEFGELAIGLSSLQVEMSWKYEVEIFIQYSDTYV